MSAIKKHLMVIVLTGLWIAACSPVEIIRPDPVYTPIINAALGAEEYYSGPVGSQEFHFTDSFSFKANNGKSPEVKDVKGSGQTYVSVKVTPFYAFEGYPGNGDYYIVEASATVNSKDMFQKDTLYNYNWFERDSDDINKYYGSTENKIKMLGCYLGEVFLKYQLTDVYGNIVGTFPTGYSPTPETTIETTTYKTGFTFSLSGSIKVIIDKTGAVAVVADVKPGFKFVNQQSHKTELIEVLNLSSQPEVGYRFIINNDAAEATPLKVPEIAKISATFNQSWIWRVPTVKDGDTTTRFKLRCQTNVKHSAHSYAGNEDYPDLLRFQQWHNFYSPLRTAEFDIIPPSRMPMGRLSIENSEEKNYITNIKVYRYDSKKGISDEPVYVDAAGYRSGNTFSAKLDVGEYFVVLDKGPSRSKLTTCELAIESVEVRQNQEVTLQSSYHFE